MNIFPTDIEPVRPEDQAAFVNTMVRQFMESCTCEVENAVADLVSMLMHWAAREGMDAVEEIHRGQDCFFRETAEAAFADWPPESDCPVGNVGGNLVDAEPSLPDKDRRSLDSPPAAVPNGAMSAWEELMDPRNTNAFELENLKLRMLAFVREQYWFPEGVWKRGETKTEWEEQRLIREDDRVVRGRLEYPDDDLEEFISYIAWEFYGCEQWWGDLYGILTDEQEEGLFQIHGEKALLALVELINDGLLTHRRENGMVFITVADLDPDQLLEP